MVAASRALSTVGDLQRGLDVPCSHAMREPKNSWREVQIESATATESAFIRCYHGVGHGVVQYYRHSSENVSQTTVG